MKAALELGVRENDNAAFYTGMEALCKVLPLVVCEPDGSPSFTGPDDPIILLVPYSLAGRMLRVAVANADKGAPFESPAGFGFRSRVRTGQ